MALFGVGNGLRIENSDGRADLLFGVSDPSVTGKSAPEGSLYLRSDGISYKKIGPLDTDWEKSTQVEGGTTGFIFVTGASNTGNIGNEVYVPNTVPENTVMTECTSDTSNVEIEFLAEPSSFYSPTITLSGTTCGNLTQFGNDRRLFTGSFNVNLTCGAGNYQDFLLESSTGQSASVRINLAGLGPAINSITFGPYPGTQTALKAGDLIGVTVVVENEAVDCWIQDGHACDGLVNLTLGPVDGAGPGLRNATGTITISDTPNNDFVTAQASNALGTNGAPFDSGNLTIDQAYPIITINSITYPVGQGAIKESESATVNATVTNWSSGTDVISYTSPNGDLSITDSTTYVENKTVSRIGGSYNITVDNYTITATKVNNNAVTTESTVVFIANVAPELSIVLPAARLRSGSTGFSNVGLTSNATVAEHTITINSNQRLNAVPTLADPAAGLGSWASPAFAANASMNAFTNNLQVPDDSTRGTHNWGAISATGLAGIVTTTITSGPNYTIGGFVPRYYPIQIGQNSVSGDVEATTYTKVNLAWEYRNGNGVVKTLTRSSTINQSPPVSDEFTIDAVNSNPTTFIIIDTAATQSQTAATSVLVEEEV